MRQRRLIPRVLMISATLGGVIGLVFRDPNRPLFRSLLIGVAVGLLLPVLLEVVRRVVRNSRMVAMRFWLFTLINLALNASVIVVALLLVSLPFGGISPDARVGVFVSVAVVAVVFTVWFTIDRLLGEGVLFGLLTGRYHHPIHEERVFLFGDMADSTPIAQRLGDLQYHSLLNRLFTEIGLDIGRHRGTVHSYVGDEIVVTWTGTAGLEDATCLRCALAILDTVTEAGPGFHSEFGVTPRLRISLHAGEVVAGEIAGLKRQIVFSGDTVNTAARIEEVAGQTDNRLVISDDLLKRLDLPLEIEVHSIGSFQLKGRKETTELFAATTRLKP